MCRASTWTIPQLRLMRGNMACGMSTGLANLRLTVGRGSLRSISRPFFFFFSIFFVIFRFWKFFVREILEREKNFTRKNQTQKFEKFCKEKFWSSSKIFKGKLKSRIFFKKKIGEQKNFFKGKIRGEEPSRKSVKKICTK